MRTFAQKPKATQQTTSAKPKTPGKANFGQSGEGNSILHLQRTIGNQAVQRLLEANTLHVEGDSITTKIARFGHDFSRIPAYAKEPVKTQTKLTVNTPGDVYQQEADRIADQVMATPTYTAISGAPPRIQRFAGQSNGQMDATPASVDQALASPGRPLDPALRQDMEQRFGYDFSRVRVHSDVAAEQSAQDVNAHAYTMGNDIVFGAGRFAPESRAGGRLLAHELTHVVQQRGGAAAVQRQPAAPDPSAERVAAAAEAEAAASVASEQVEAQSDAEDALKLNWRKRNDKNYAWSLGLKDRARLQKRSELSPELQQEITVKIRFFGGEAKAAYIRTISPALADFPAEQVIAILAEPAGTSATGGERTQGLACDVGAKQFLLQYEGEPKKSRCMDIEKDPEFKADYFDKNITGAVGYAVEATTWENVAYDRFKGMLVHYKNGTSEFFLLDEVGNFYYGGKALITLEYSYLKRENGLIYPLRKGQIYFNEVLTPNIIAYKNGLK